MFVKGRFKPTLPHMIELLCKLKFLITRGRTGPPSTPKCYYPILASGGKKFSLLQNRPCPLWGPHNLLVNGYWCSFPGAKRPGSEIDSSLLPSVGIKNEWSYTFAPPVHLHGMTGTALHLPYDRQFHERARRAGSSMKQPRTPCKSMASRDTSHTCSVSALQYQCLGPGPLGGGEGHAD